MSLVDLVRTEIRGLQGSFVDTRTWQDNDLSRAVLDRINTRPDKRKLFHESVITTNNKKKQRNVAILMAAAELGSFPVFLYLSAGIQYIELIGRILYLCALPVTSYAAALVHAQYKFYNSLADAQTV